MRERLLKKIDKIVINNLDSVRFTDKGRLDFPSRLPFCFKSIWCTVDCCIFTKLYKYLISNKRFPLEKEKDVIEVECKGAIPLLKPFFPNIFHYLDLYTEEEYETSLFPVISRFYDKEFIKRLIKKEEL